MSKYRQKIFAHSGLDKHHLIKVPASHSSGSYSESGPSAVEIMGPSPEDPRCGGQSQTELSTLGVIGGEGECFLAF